MRPVPVPLDVQLTVEGIPAAQNVLVDPKVGLHVRCDEGRFLGVRMHSRP